MTSTSTYNVTGMTCAHCVQSVTKALSRLPGVSGVRVDLDSGDVEVDSADGAVDRAEVAGAVEEAGYSLTA